ncbi:hypothetical protein KDL01_26200 [Actinospica durhamensis]|uniref:Uncharacterized protein n=1 Tax=Actinospica durhamensis TaxID=1508375 RepID=A0A941ESN2_9ACTN|nr:hypothetical protein [Actinospica durhamensis]MBR7836800.1 hypothetical protein [Actinospica durhamensis]
MAHVRGKDAGGDVRIGRAGLIWIAAVAGTGIVVLAVLLVLLPDKALAWAGAAVAAAVAAAGRRLGDAAGTLVGKRVARHELDVAEPFTTDVSLRNVDYVVFEDGDEPEDVAASGHTVQLIVTGTYPKPVLLTGMRVEVLSRAARSGTLTRHAAEVPRRRFEVLLDAKPPQVRPLGESDFPFQVALDESEALHLRITTESGLVTWVGWLDWRSGRRSGSVRVDLDGRALRAAGRHAALPERRR